MATYYVTGTTTYTGFGDHAAKAEERAKAYSEQYPALFAYCGPCWDGTASQVVYLTTARRQAGQEAFAIPEHGDGQLWCDGETI